MKRTAQKTAQGFTLVELLIVIAIIAILAAVVVLIVNPIELTKRGRDAARFSDLSSLQQAINVVVQERSSNGESMEDILCVGTTAPCTGTTDGDSRDPDGTGWVLVDFTGNGLPNDQSLVSVPTLPKDPVNNGTYHYTYCSDGTSWEIDTALESDQQSDKMVSDGGDQTTLYEVGSSLTLLSTSGGDCPGY